MSPCASGSAIRVPCPYLHASAPVAKTARHVEAPAMRSVAIRRSRSAAGGRGGWRDRWRLPVRAGRGDLRRCRRGCRSKDRQGCGHGAYRARRQEVAEPVRLAQRFAVPGEPEPRKIRERGADIFGARTAAVDIVDTDDEPAVRGARAASREHCAIGVAKMEVAGRAGRETGQHRAGKDSIYCAALIGILPYLAADAPLTSESDAACNDRVTQETVARHPEKKGAALPSHVSSRSCPASR